MAQRDEVEEFLRRAAARRAAAQGQGPMQPRPAAPQPPPQLFQPTPRPATLAEVVMRQPAPTQRLVPAPQPHSGWQPVEAELIEPELVEIPNEVSRSVMEHMRGTQEIADRVRHLGEEVDQADDKLEARLHQVFDHRVGQLKVRPADTPAKTPVPPAATGAFTPGDIAQMLLSPASIRSAIILGEVLRRPEDRW